MTFRWMVIACALVGCGNKGPQQAPPTPEAEADAKANEDLADRMCACKDSTCFTAINADFSKWNESGKQGSPAQAKRIADARTRYTECSDPALQAARKNPGARGAEPYVKVIEGYADTACACTDLRCLEQVNDTMASYNRQWGTPEAIGTPTPAQTQRLEDTETRYNGCQARLLGAAEAELAAAPDAAPAAPSTLTAGCQKFKAAVEAFASCNTMTPAIRDNLFSAYDNLEKTDDLCAQGITAIKEPAARMGCTLPE